MEDMAVAVAPVATVAAAATEKSKRERGAAAAVEAVAAAEDKEERAEATVGVAPTIEVENPELPRGCKRAMMRICLPCPFGTGKIV